MSSLFLLAEAILARLGFAAKVAVIAALALVPITYLGSLQFMANRSAAQTMRLEVLGLTYLAGIRAVYEKVP